MIAPAALDCLHFQRGECRSCSWIDTAYAAQLEQKQAACADVLGAIPAAAWEPPFASAVAGFRNKAKLVVGGSTTAPTLGILDADGSGRDLDLCRLYPSAISACFAPLRAWITATRIAPYAVPTRRGELKHLLINHDPASGVLMLRIVLRSREALQRIRDSLPALLSALPLLRVVSVNLQPLHAAILEGEVEIPLGPDEALPLGVNGLRLWLQPGGFWQTNSEVAAGLYRTAADWCAALPITRVLDLFCGIGGFALHLAAADRDVQGLELSPAAIAAAQRAAIDNALPAARFVVADADTLDTSRLAGHDLVVVNPPRRGVGETTCSALVTAAPRWILYSSCNPTTLARDIERLGHYTPRRAQLFDMFPHTPHAEVLVLLERQE
jgi:23S rRNA (uracil747-C5)-methyltransferase